MEKSQTSKEIFDAYVERSWRQMAQRQRAKGTGLVLGKREGCYIWNLEGDRRLLDCGGSGGVHSLGHRHPEIVAAMHAALDSGLDAGLWTAPSAELLAVQDTFAASAPVPELSRSVLTCTATQSIDLALMFSYRMTGRKKVVAYRHGYHGHGGLAALVTGSDKEGVLDHYSLPAHQTVFFEQYGDIRLMERLVDRDCTAVILEPMNYETFQPAPTRFLPELEALCRDRGVLLIIDETRTGLGRSGKLWMTGHYELRPDMLITGKGLGGGLYPVSAVLTTETIYDRCMNGEKYGYLSSMGGNPLAAVIASKVLEITRRPALAANVARLERQLRAGFATLCGKYPQVFDVTAVLGGIATIGLQTRAHRAVIAGALFERGVQCHSISEVDPLVVKFFPPLISDPAVGAELIAALDGFAADAVRKGPEPAAALP
jgi:acetylornithine/succinyldiaminopimelate/putrescine aminotransferase